MEIEGIPPVLAPEPSVADVVRSSIRKEVRQSREELLLPGYENLFITFRPLEDFGELQTVIDADMLAHLPAATQQVQAAINTLVATSVGSYALVDGKKVDIGLPLGVALYDIVSPVEDGDTFRPATDGEAVALMFGSDTVSLVMFARKLNVWRKITSVLIESNPGKF